MRRNLSSVFWLACGALLASSPAAAANELKPTAPPESPGMKPLFNGRNLDGWDGDPRLWSVAEGVVRGETTPEKAPQENTFLIWKGGDVGDFELRLSFRLNRGNSGVQYRSQRLPEQDGNRWRVAGHQAEIEDTPGKVGFAYQERGRGHLAEVGDMTVIGPDAKPQVVGSLGSREAIGATYKKGDWNDYVIIFEGNHLRHYLNGFQTIDLIDNDAKNSPKKGLLALQLHCGEPMWVEFKNVRMKQRTAKAESTP